MAMNLIEKVAHFKAGEALLLNFERLAAKMGVDEDQLLELYLSIKNASHKHRFTSTPYHERIVLLPQCLRSKDCTAQLGEYGYICKNCGKCKIYGISQIAKKLKYKDIFILSGGRIVKKIFNKMKIKACIGVACVHELVLGGFIAEKFGVAVQAVQLTKDGCVDTDVDLHLLQNTLQRYVSHP